MDNLDKVWGNHAKKAKQKFNFPTRQRIEKSNDPLAQFLVKLAKNKTGKFLDAGCGIGQYVAAAKVLGFDAKGIDISQKAVNIARKNNLDVIKGDLRNLPFKDNYFDVVVAGGSVEHFPETELAIKEISRVLKKSGIFIGNVPHKYSVFTVSKLIQQLLGVWKIGYEKSFSIKKFKKILKKYNFKIFKLHRTKIAVGKHKILSSLLRLADEPLFLLGLGGAHFHFYCKKIN